MTKMAMMPIYGKNHKNPSSQEPKGWWPWNLVCSIGCSSTTKFVQMMTWVDHDIFTARSNLVPYAFVWEKGKKNPDFSETIVVSDLKPATDDQSDKKILLTSKLCLLGTVCPLPRGYIHVLNHEKNCIKSDFKEIFFFWNLQQIGKVIRPFCWHQNFVSWGLSAPAPGLHTCIKSLKRLYKIRLQRHFF